MKKCWSAKDMRYSLKVGKRIGYEQGKKDAIKQKLVIVQNERSIDNIVKQKQIEVLEKVLKIMDKEELKCETKDWLSIFCDSYLKVEQELKRLRG